MTVNRALTKFELTVLSSDEERDDGDRITFEVSVRYQRKSQKATPVLAIDSKVLSVELGAAWHVEHINDQSRARGIADISRVGPVVGSLCLATALPGKDTYFDDYAEQAVTAALKDGEAARVLAKVAEVEGKVEAAFAESKATAISLDDRKATAEAFAAKARAYFAAQGITEAQDKDANAGECAVRIKTWSQGDIVRIYFNWFTAVRGAGRTWWSLTAHDLFDSRPRMLYVNNKGKLAGKRSKALPAAIATWEAATSAA